MPILKSSEPTALTLAVVQTAAACIMKKAVRSDTQELLSQSALSEEALTQITRTAVSQYINRLAPQAVL